MYCNSRFEDLVWSVSPKADGYRSTMALVQDIAGKDVGLLPW
jgi:hypothetical protein